jgi:hypothetical protein
MRKEETVRKEERGTTVRERGRQGRGRTCGGGIDGDRGQRRWWIDDGGWGAMAVVGDFFRRFGHGGERPAHG